MRTVTSKVTHKAKRVMAPAKKARPKPLRAARAVKTAAATAAREARRTTAGRAWPSGGSR